MICTECGATSTSVVKSGKLRKSIIERIRICDECLDSFFTYEKAGCPKCGEIGQCNQTQKIGGLVKRWRHCTNHEQVAAYTTHEERGNSKPVYTSSTTSTSSTSSSTTSTSSSSTTTTSSQSTTTSTTSDYIQTDKPEEDIWKKVERQLEDTQDDDKTEDTKTTGYSKKSKKTREPSGKYRKGEVRGSKRPGKNS